MKKPVLMGFPYGEDGDVMYLGESHIDRRNMVRIPKPMLDKYDVRAGDKLIWFVKGNTPFVRVHHPS